MNSRVLFWSVTSALDGFLFGFDTVVISGAEQTIQSLWKLSDTTHGIAMAAALYGTVVGAMAGGWPSDRFGRRPTLLWIGIFYFVSAVWSGTVVAPMYISEIAPPRQRGRLNRTTNIGGRCNFTSPDKKIRF